MKILFAASEALPFMASGGLADVAGSLPKALEAMGQETAVVMPLYGDIKPELRDKCKYLTNFTVPLSWRNLYCGVFKAVVNSVTYYLIDNEYYFRRSGIYGFFDDGERFAFFSKAILEMLNHIDFAPDIIHCNDWQTALVPVFLNRFYRQIEKFKNIKTVFTIHNVQYQGQYGFEVADDILGIERRYVEYDGCVNYMKGGIEQCDIISTVSPTYAHELMDEWYAHGMDRLLRQYSYKLRGILNGIDVDSYNPASDKAIYKNYDASTIKNKQINKTMLQKEVGLIQNNDVMLIGIVTRLVSHKGLDLVKYILKKFVEEDMQIVILGSGDYIYESFFNEMAALYPGRVAFKCGFIPSLARKIYAGADVFLMPSKSEPCGLAQMVAARYGTLPIVRKTGGLADSIKDLGEEGGNGYTFLTYNAHDMAGAVLRAKGLFYNKPEWDKAVLQAMSSDFSWKRSAKEYVDMYNSIM